MAYLTLIVLLSTIYLSGYALLKFVYAHNKLNKYIVIATSFALGVTFLQSLLTLMLAFNIFKYSHIAIYVILIVSIMLVFHDLRKQDIRNIMVLKSININSILLLIAFLIMTLWLYLTQSIAYDSYAIWFFKSKVFFLEPSFPNSLYNSGNLFYAHFEYPIGIPLLLSAYYKLSGGLFEANANFILITFYFNLIILLSGIIKTIRHSFLQNFHSVAALLLIVLPTFTEKLYHGYADIPLSFLFSILIFFVWQSIAYTNKSVVFLALIISTAPLMTKSEGAPFTFITWSILPLVILSKRKLMLFNAAHKTYLVKIVFLMSLYIFGGLYWFFVKSTYNYSSEHTLIVNFSHYISNAPEVMSHFVRLILSTEYNFMYIFAIVSSLFLTGLHLARKQYQYILVIFIIVIQLVIYIFIYLNSYNTEWLLMTSGDRLLLQLYPPLIVYTLCCLQNYFITSNTS